MAIGDEIILDRLTARETQLHDQSDALDVKASILLVAVTFLAGQTTYLLTKNPAGYLRWEQLSSAFLLFVAAVVLAFMLRIRTYDGECAEDYLTWRDDIIAEFGETAEKRTTDHMRTEIVSGCKARIEKARGINQSKVRQVKAIFILTLAAFALNLAAVLAPFF